MLAALDLLTDLQNGDADPWLSVTKHFRSLGINGVVCGKIVRSTGTMVGALIDAADDWQERYQAEGYNEVDPWAKLIPETNDPFLYSFEDRKRYLPHLCPHAERLCMEAAETDHRSSILLPALTTPDAKLAVNVWTGDDRKLFEVWAAEHMRTLSMMACLSANHLCDALTPSSNRADVLFFDELAGCDNPLTRREQEALLWLAKGYRTDRIAERMNITNATVAFHIQSARKRLGASTREQAIAVAVSSGLIIV